MGVLLLHILNRLFYTGVCVESTILVCHQTQSDCPHLTGNQVTYVTSLQMLSENRLVCQEAAIALYNRAFISVPVNTLPRALRHPPHDFVSAPSSGHCTRVVRGDHRSLSRAHAHMTWEEGNICGWNMGGIDFSLYSSPRAVFKSHFAFQFSVFEAINNKNMSLLASWRLRQLKPLAQDWCIHCMLECLLKVT